MLYPVTVLVLELGSLFTFTNSLKPSFTGTPILNFFPFVGISQPLGTEVISPGHMTVILFVEFNVLTIPLVDVQNVGEFRLPMRGPGVY